MDYCEEDLARKAKEEEDAPMEMKQLLQQCEESVLEQMEEILKESNSVKEAMSRSDYAVEEFFSHRAEVKSSTLWRRIFNQEEDPEQKALKKKLQTVINRPFFFTFY